MVVSVTCMGSFFPHHFHNEFINVRKHEKKHAQWFGDSGWTIFFWSNSWCKWWSSHWVFPSSTLAQITNGLLQVDLEQTQRLVEREEGLSLAHKFNCSFYETSAAHRSPHLTDPHHSSTIFFTICASRRHVDDVFHTLVREIRKRDEEGEFKENETSRWKKVWNNIFKTIKRGRRKV